MQTKDASLILLSMQTKDANGNGINGQMDELKMQANFTKYMYIKITLTSTENLAPACFAIKMTWMQIKIQMPLASMICILSPHISIWFYYNEIFVKISFNVRWSLQTGGLSEGSKNFYDEWGYWIQRTYCLQHFPKAFESRDIVAFVKLVHMGHFLCHIRHHVLTMSKMSDITSDKVSHIKPAHIGHFQFYVRHVPHGPHILRTLAC